MRPGQREPSGAEDLFRTRFDQIVDMRHALVQLAGRTEGDRPDRDLARCFSR